MAIACRPRPPSRRATGGELLRPAPPCDKAIGGERARHWQVFFLASHGIPSPEFFWKTIITQDPDTGTAKAISWIIPNEAGMGSLDTCLVSIADLEALLRGSHVAINAPASPKNMLPSGCDPS